MWWSTLTRRLEHAERLDPLVDKATAAVDAVLPRGPVKDALHGRWVGHPLHPLLVAVPIGMWSGASLLDLLAGEESRPAARRLVGAGLLVALPTAASGYADWSELGLARRPRRVGLVHAGTNWVALGLYGASWLARGRRGRQRRARNLALLGAGALSAGGYLGGHLAYSQGVGVSRNAGHQPEPTGWTDACAESDVPDGGLHRVQVADQPVVLARSAGAVHALGDTCSHWGGPLADGTLETGDDGPCVVCPWHGSRFRLSDGGVARGPASMPQPVYDVRVQDGRVQVRLALP